METTLAYTDAFQSLSSLIKADTDVINVPRTVRKVTLANRSANQVFIKRTGSTSTPSNAEGFTLDAEQTGIWYITLENVDLQSAFIKAVVASDTGNVDISIEI